MPVRATIYVPTENIRPGTAVQLVGPNDAGILDDAAVVPGQRDCVASHPTKGLAQQGPLDLGTAGGQTKPIVLRSGALVFGTKEFAVRAIDARTGQPTGDALETKTVRVDSTPVPARYIRPLAPDVSGRLRFAIGNKGVLV